MQWFVLLILEISLTVFSIFIIHNTYVSLSYNKDIDECTNGSNDCDENADCSNTDGSYTCSCQSGFSGDGMNCSGQ